MIERYLIRDGESRYEEQITDFSPERIRELAKRPSISFVAVFDDGSEEAVDPSEISKPDTCRSASIQTGGDSGQMAALLDLIDTSLKPALALIPRTARGPIEEAYERFRETVNPTEGRTDDDM